MLYGTEVFTGILYFVMYFFVFITLSSYLVGKWHKQAGIFDRTKKKKKMHRSGDAGLSQVTVYCLLHDKLLV